MRWFIRWSVCWLCSLWVSETAVAVEISGGTSDDQPNYICTCVCTLEP